jgi:POLQ-like helicase
MVVNQSQTKTESIWPYKRLKPFENQLRVTAAKWFSQKGFMVLAKMPYCLRSKDRWRDNIICEDVVGHIEDEIKRKKGDEPFPFHKYIHHGLSSQAMLFNLIGPLVVKKDFEPLAKVFGEAGLRWPQGGVEAEFEYENRKVFDENVGQPTSIDLKISGNDTSLFVEAKLAERGFGGCSIFSGGDCEGINPGKHGLETCYLHSIGRTYWEKLEMYEFINGAFKDTPICPLANYYQFFREVLFAISEGGTFVLLHDERNPAFINRADSGEADRGLWPFLMQFVPEQQRRRLARISIQQVVSAIEESGRHDDWIGDFRVKYGLTDF